VISFIEDTIAPLVVIWGLVVPLAAAVTVWDWLVEELRAP